MTWNIKKYLFSILLVITLLLAGFGSGLLPINLFFVKDTISETIHERLGVVIEIDGPLRVRLGPRPTLSASGVSISSNRPARQKLAVIDSLKIRSKLLSIVNVDLDLQKLEASGVTLEMQPYLPSGLLPGKLDLTASAPYGKPLDARVSGHLRGDPLELLVSGESLSRLLENPDTYPLNLKIKALSSEFVLDGTVQHPLESPALHGTVEFKSANLPQLLAGTSLVAIKFNSLNFRSGILFGGEEIRVDRLEGDLDGNPFLLSGQLRDLSSRPRIELDAELPRLDFAGFAGQDNPAAEDMNPMLADLQPLYDGISGFDGHLNLRIGQLLNVPLAPVLDNLAVEARLEQGRLSLERASVELGDNEIVAQAVLDSRAICPSLETRLSTSALDLGALEALVETGSGLDGSLDHIELTSRSCGASMQEHIDSLQFSAEIDGLAPGLDGQELPLEFSRLAVRAGRNQAGEISFDGELSSEPLSAFIGFPSIASIEAGEEGPVDVSIEGESFRASMNGAGAIRDDGLSLDVTLTASVSRMGQLHAWLGTAPGSQLSFQGQSGLRLDEAGLTINNLDARLGASDLRGTLNWNGPDSGQPLLVNFQSARLDLNEIAGLFPAEASAEQEALWEWTELLDQNDQIERWFSFPSIDFQVAVDHLVGAHGEAEDVLLLAKLQDHMIEEGRLNLRFEGVDMAGSLDANLRKLPWRVDFDSVLENIDIGRLLRTLELAEDVNARAGRVDVRLVSQGTSMRELLLAVQMDSRIENLHWVLEGGPENRLFDIRLSELEVTSSPASNTTWRVSGDLNGSPVRAWMQTPSLHDTFDPSGSLPMTLVLGAANGVVMLDMDIERVAEHEVLGEVVLSGEFVDPGQVDFANLRSPLGAYQLQTRLDIKENTYLMSELQARIGDSSASATIEIRPDGPGYHFDLDLHSPFLETDDLVHWAEEFRTAQRVIREEKTDEKATDVVNKGLLKLINEYINEFTREDNFNISASVDELRSSGVLLGKAGLELIMTDEELRLDPLTIALPGGNVDVSYHDEAVDTGWEYSLDVDVERLEYGGLLRLLDAESRASGEVFLDIDVHSRAHDPALVVSNLAGHVDLVVFPEDVEAGFLDIWASNLVLALLPFGENSGKKLNCVVGRFEVENGVMTAGNTFLDSTDIIVRTRGEIDLGEKQLDLLVAPQAKREKFLSVSTPIAVTGPFDDFQVGAAPGSFLNTMLRWYYGLVYVPWKWLTGERFPPDGVATCYKAMGWEQPEH